MCPYQAHGLGEPIGIQRVEPLVYDQDRRLSEEGSNQTHHLTLPGGKSSAVLTDFRAEAGSESAQKRFDRQFTEALQKSLWRKVGRRHSKIGPERAVEDFYRFRNEGHVSAIADKVDRFSGHTVNRKRSFGEWVAPSEEVNQRTLAAAVGPTQPGDLASLERVVP